MFSVWFLPLDDFEFLLRAILIFIDNGKIFIMIVLDFIFFAGELLFLARQIEVPNVFVLAAFDDCCIPLRVAVADAIFIPASLEGSCCQQLIFPCLLDVAGLFMWLLLFFTIVG